jgi:hypothetical protein
MLAMATVSDLFNGQHYQRVVSTPTVTQGDGFSSE